MFVAHGPFSAVVKAIEAERSRTPASKAKTPMRRLASSLFGHDAAALTRPNKGWHSTADDTYVMDTFQNVEIYNLMMKLVGIEDRVAPTNGTKGFWDKYF